MTGRERNAGTAMARRQCRFAPRQNMREKPQEKETEYMAAVKPRLEGVTISQRNTLGKQNDEASAQFANFQGNPDVKANMIFPPL